MRACKVPVGRNDIGLKVCPETETLELAASCFEQIELDIAGRRHNADRVALAERGRFDPVHLSAPMLPNAGVHEIRRALTF